MYCVWSTFFMYSPIYNKLNILAAMCIIFWHIAFNLDLIDCTLQFASIFITTQNILSIKNCCTYMNIKTYWTHNTRHRCTTYLYWHMKILCICVRTSKLYAYCREERLTRTNGRTDDDDDEEASEIWKMKKKTRRKWWRTM